MSDKELIEKIEDALAEVERAAAARAGIGGDVPTVPDHSPIRRM